MNFYIAFHLVAPLSSVTWLDEAAPKCAARSEASEAGDACRGQMTMGQPFIPRICQTLFAPLNNRARVDVCHNTAKAI